MIIAINTLKKVHSSIVLVFLVFIRTPWINTYQSNLFPIDINDCSIDETIGVCTEPFIICTKNSSIYVLKLRQLTIRRLNYVFRKKKHFIYLTIRFLEHRK